MGRKKVENDDVFNMVAMDVKAFGSKYSRGSDPPGSLVPLTSLGTLVGPFSNYDN